VTNAPSAQPLTVLVVDDDQDYRLMVVRALDKAGMRCVAAPNGASALALLEGPEGPRIDVILLDVKMPEQTGWDVLERWRKSGKDTPVIFLTGYDQLEHRLHGLNLGADDYVPKGLDFKELVARIQAVSRRRRATSTIVRGDLEIDVVRRIVKRGRRTLELSPREFDLLRVMASQPNRTWTRAELLAEVWGIRFDPETNMVNVHIARLRKKLEVLGSPVIHTVRGEGYVFALERPPEADLEAGGSTPGT
jgi:two-component system, OmpR family, copper resistance phosphate regulon response regulator CusR